MRLPDFPELVFGGFQEIDTVEHRGSGMDFSGRLGDESEERIAGHGFARSGFADNPKGFAFFQREGNILDRVDDAIPGVESGGEIADVENWHVSPKRMLFRWPERKSPNPA